MKTGTSYSCPLCTSEVPSFLLVDTVPISNHWTRQRLESVTGGVTETAAERCEPYGDNSI